MDKNGKSQSIEITLGQSFILHFSSCLCTYTIHVQLELHMYYYSIFSHKTSDVSQMNFILTCLIPEAISINACPLIAMQTQNPKGRLNLLEQHA